MRGSPLLRLALVLAGLLLVLIPLRRLTSRDHAPANDASPATQETKTSAVKLTLTSTSAPFRFTVTHLGQPLWSGESTSESVTRELALPYPGEGIDLLVEAQWPGENAAALKIDVAPAGRAPSTAVLWGRKQAGDVFTFR